MLVQSLEHLAQSALALAQSRKIFILGSSRVFPNWARGLLDNIFDADLLLDPVIKGISDLLKEAIGDGSLFEKERGYHAASCIHRLLKRCRLARKGVWWLTRTCLRIWEAKRGC